jgi:hypothetical protein
VAHEFFMRRAYEKAMQRRKELAMGATSTSLRAYESTRPYAPNKRQRIYEWIRNRGYVGGTADEFYAATGQSHTGNGTLFYDLAAVGFIRQSPNEPERETRTKRMATVWIITDKEVTEGCFSNPYYAHLHPKQASRDELAAAIRLICKAIDDKDAGAAKAAILAARSLVQRQPTEATDGE